MVHMAIYYLLIGLWLWGGKGVADPVLNMAENSRQAIAESSSRQQGTAKSRESLAPFQKETRKEAEEKENFYEALREERGQVSLREQAAVLKELGLDCVTEEEIRQIEESIEMEKEENPEYYEMALDLWTGPYYQYRMLLSGVGMGEYDYEDWSWTPSVDGPVYSFDYEVFELSLMYTNFLRGVEALGKGEFAITDIEEDNRLVNWEAGTGIKKVTFSCNGHPYTWYLRMTGDWFDTSAIDQFNYCLKKENSKKRLYNMWDGGQGVILFYCTEEWAESFTEKTLCPITLRVQ